MALILAAGIAASAIVHFSHLSHWHRYRNIFFYDDNLPLMTTLDAYYYLRLAADLSKGQYEKSDELRPASSRPQPVPLLVSLTSWIQRATGAPLDRIGFYLPPLLASLMVIPYLLWGRRLGGHMTALVASLAGASSYYWYSRTCLGRFDTDCLNPFFVLLIAYTAYLFAVEQKPVRFAWLIASLALAALFGLWWPQTRLLGFALLAFSYSLSFFLPSSRTERLLKIGLLAVGALLAIAALLGFSSVFPGPIRNAMQGGLALMRMIAKETVSVFPNVGQSISELEAPSVMEIAVKVGGHAIPFVLAMVGLVFLAIRRPDGAVFLASGLLLGLGSFFSRRFLIFMVPYYALGLGYLIGEVALRSKIMEKLPGSALRTGAAGLLAAALMAPGFVSSIENHRVPHVTANEVTLARAAARDASPEAAIWAWWDYGYFLQYMTGKRTFIDGGMQSPERTFISAFPMSCSDPVLAQNWIRFFAAHDLKGLRRLKIKLGSFGKAVAFLKEALASPERAEEIIRDSGLRSSSAWMDYLFPDSDAYVFLNQDFLSKAYWWYYFGTWSFDSRQGVHADAVRINGGDPQTLEKQGFINMGGRSVRIDRVAYVDNGGASVKRLGKPASSASGPNGRDVERSDKLAVFFKGTSTGYILDGSVFGSLAGALLLDKPMTTPGFSALTYHPLYGGVWRVADDG